MDFDESATSAMVSGRNLKIRARKIRSACLAISGLFFQSYSVFGQSS